MAYQGKLRRVKATEILPGKDFALGNIAVQVSKNLSYAGV